MSTTTVRAAIARALSTGPHVVDRAEVLDILARATTASLARSTVTGGEARAIADLYRVRVEVPEGATPPAPLPHGAVVMTPEVADTLRSFLDSYSIPYGELRETVIARIGAAVERAGGRGAPFTPSHTLQTADMPMVELDGSTSAAIDTAKNRVYLRTSEAEPRWYGPFSLEGLDVPPPSVKAFDDAWAAARRAGGPTGAKVDVRELRGALTTLTADGLSRFEAGHAAARLSEAGTYSAAARAEALRFLETVTAGRSELDGASVEALKAAFALKAASSPGKALKIPGTEVKNSLDAPESVARDTAERWDASGKTWRSGTAYKLTLAGIPVYAIVHRGLGDDTSAERVMLYSLDGRKRLATGRQPALSGGFAWDRPA